MAPNASSQGWARPFVCRPSAAPRFLHASFLKRNRARPPTDCELRNHLVLTRSNRDEDEPSSLASLDQRIHTILLSTIQMVMCIHGGRSVDPPLVVSICGGMKACFSIWHTPASREFEIPICTIPSHALATGRRAARSREGSRTSALHAASCMVKFPCICLHSII